MKHGTSLYLDLVRFCAALVVFLEHLRIHTTGGFGAFWNYHLHYYGQTAVAVFFALSGYVIAHVLATRERTLLQYSASRFGRLYSVVLPALILIAVCNYLVEIKYPNLFEPFDSLGGTGAALRYLGTALFMNRFWLWSSLEPPSAVAFWSLSFEVSYYVAIALFVFARGRFRFLGLVLLSALAGPAIVLLAPTWFLGYGAYHVSQRRQLPPTLAIVLWVGFNFLLLLCPLIEERVQPLYSLRIGGLLAFYAASICFSLSLLAFNAISDRAEPLFLPFVRLIRWLGSMTFALYLFHFPLLSVFTVYAIGEPSSALSMIWKVGGTFLIVTTLGHSANNRRVLTDSASYGYGDALRRFAISWRGDARTELEPFPITLNQKKCPSFL